MKTKFWTDAKVRCLSPEEKLIFLYLVTNPHAHLSGLYYLPLALVEDETGIRPSWPSLWAKFAELDIAHYDMDTRYVWVVKMFHNQGGGPKVLMSVMRHLDSLHACELVERFRGAYKIPLVHPTMNEAKKQPHPWPEGFTPTERHVAMAKGLGINLQRELAKFESKARAKGYTYLDWDAAFRNWLTNAADYQDQRRAK